MLGPGVHRGTRCVPPAGELRSNIHGESDNDARVLRHALTPGPALLGTVRRGGNGPHTGHCFARPRGPSLRSARQSDRARFVGSAQREPTPGAAAKQQPGLSPLPTPAGCAEKRRSWGGRVCRRTHTLRRLARRCCLSGVRRTKRVHRRPPQIRASQVARSEAKGRRLGAAFSLVTFSWRPKRKLLRRRAHIPAPDLQPGKPRASKKGPTNQISPPSQHPHAADQPPQTTTSSHAHAPA
jgi:hypothetical protein